jgi:hypothetical protein
MFPVSCSQQFVFFFGLSLAKREGFVRRGGGGLRCPNHLYTRAANQR